MNRVKNPCPFCNQKSSVDIIAENELAFAAFDIYAVSKGHCLVITKRHIESFFEVSKEEVDALFSLVNEAKELLDQRYNPDGYNVGINVATAAGQTIPHVHIHLIPRYDGDVENPRGGVRNVIPGKGDY
jgi:diadenosine tetraphosphate (Ap4A) HIT family hydrolase